MGDIGEIKFKNLWGILGKLNTRYRNDQIQIAQIHTNQFTGEKDLHRSNSNILVFSSDVAISILRWPGVTNTVPNYFAYKVPFCAQVFSFLFFLFIMFSHVVIQQLSSLL